MKQFIEIAGAASIGFVLATLYLRHERTSVGTQVESAPSPSMTAEHLPSAPPISSGVIASHQKSADATQRSTKPSAAAALTTPSTQADDLSRLVEIRELDEYFGGVSNISPLNAEQKKALLESKLRHKKQFDLTLNDSGATRNSLSTSEREHAQITTARALRDFHDDFLIDAKALLTEQQYTALADFEATELKRRIIELEVQINSK